MTLQLENWDFQDYEIVKPIPITISNIAGRWRAECFDSLILSAWAESRQEAFESLKYTLLQLIRELHCCNTNSPLAAKLFEHIKPVRVVTIDHWPFEAYEIIKPIPVKLSQRGSRWQASFDHVRSLVLKTQNDAVKSLEFQIYNVVNESDFVGRLESSIFRDYVAPGKS